MKLVQKSAHSFSVETSANRVVLFKIKEHPELSGACAKVEIKVHDGLGDWRVPEMSHAKISVFHLPSMEWKEVVSIHPMAMSPGSLHDSPDVRFKADVDRLVSELITVLG